MDGSSSPDPLSNSTAYSSPSKTRQPSRNNVRKSFPLRSSSPKKQTFQLDLGNELSSQKIKVTVEAGDSDSEHLYHSECTPSSPSRAPTNRRVERTFTTTVPVKGLSDTEFDNSIQYAATPRRARGRPRKSGTPVPAKKRANTPSNKSAGKRRSVGELVDGDDEEDVNFRSGQSVEMRQSKSRSRSKGASRTSEALPVGTVNTGPKKRGRPRKSLPVAEVIASEDVNDVAIDSEHHSSENQFARELSDSRAHSSSTSAEPALVRGHGEPFPDVLIARFEPGNETPRHLGWSSPRAINTGRSSSTRQRADSYPSPVTSPGKSAFLDEDEDYKESAVQAEIEYMDEDEDEGDDEVGEMREFDTIMESEGFSMISVDSVHSLHEHLNSPANDLEMVTPKPILNHHLLSIKRTDAKSMNDSFSSIPEDVLEAASPMRTQLTSYPAEISVSHATNSVLQNTVSISSRQKHPVLEAINQEYEDSFSTIPNAVLDAATPAAVRRVHTTSERLSVPGQSKLFPSKTVGSPRLLTPEETPSPPHEHDVEVSSENRKSLSSGSTKEVIKSSTNSHAQMRSSPPSVAPRRYTYTAHLRNQRQLNPDVTQTPSIVFSSPSLPPPILPVKEQHNLRPNLDLSERPTLSPIARTGQMLQDILVPSSPRSRSQSLGSPFKSPGTDRRSSSIAPAPEPAPMQDRLAGPLPRLDLSSQFSDRPSQRFRSMSSAQEDPFHTDNAPKERSPSPEQDQPYKLDVPQRQSSEPRSMNRTSHDDSWRSEDAMSWQADEPFTLYQQTKSSQENVSSNNSRRYPLEREGSLAKSINLTNEERWQAERDQVRNQISSAAAEQVINIDCDNEQSNNDQVEDEEDFGLLMATLNSSSPAIKQTQLIKELVEKPRRGKLPSPWRQNSKRLVYSDEISHLSSPPSPQANPKFGREVTTHPVTLRRTELPLTHENVDSDLAGWQIPQKSNFQPRARETSALDLSAILSASPAKQLPVLAKDSQSSASQNAASSGISSAKNVTRGLVTDDLATAEMSNRGFTPIPQKMGFNPRPASPSKLATTAFPMTSRNPTQLGNVVSHSNWTSSPPVIPKPLRSSSPSRSNTLPAHHKPLLDTSSSPAVETPDSIRSSQISPDQKENRDFKPRTMDWAKSVRAATAPSAIIIPSLQAPSSPVKSCLRSPMKTPSSQHGIPFPNLSPSKAVAFVSSSPMPSSPPVAFLSSTTWSKSHWQLLDEITESWKVDSGSSDTGSSTKRRRNSTRVISRLLGKTVRSQGESMVFEQWHLEAVDEFRGMVPGWEEKVIAMRLFSLLLAADRRSRGVSGGRCY